MVRIPDGYEIGLALPDDVAKLADIERRSAIRFPEELVPVGPPPGHPLPFFEDACSDERLWVARLLGDRSIVGFAVAVSVDGSPHLEEVDILPEHGRQGLGRVLVLQVAVWAASRGHDNLTLTTFRDIPWNGPFYERLGFVEVPPSERTTELRRILKNEAERGLDPSKRVAMRLALPQPD